MNQLITKSSLANPFKPVPTEVSVGFKSIKGLTRQQNITNPFNFFALFLLLLCCTTQNIKAQYVTIPDTNFAKYLATYYPSCMNGIMLDTTCGAVVNATWVNCSNRDISDLTGIQYFDNLGQLWCWNNMLYFLPEFPNTLIELFCNKNKLTFLPKLPNLQYLDCSYNELTNLPVLPNNLNWLICLNNKLVNLPPLPSTLSVLKCGNNKIC